MKIFNTGDTGYRFNKLFFISVILIMVVLFVIAFLISGYEQHYYINCEAEVCENPLVTKEVFCQGVYCPPIKCLEDWCKQEFLTRGEYGQKPPFIQTNFAKIGWGLFFLAFFLNHVIYNRNVKFSVPSKRMLVPKWMAYLIRKFNPNFKNEIDFKKIDWSTGDEEE